MNITQNQNRNQTSFGNYYVVKVPKKAFSTTDLQQVNNTVAGKINATMNGNLAKNVNKSTTILSSDGDSYSFHVFTKEHIEKGINAVKEIKMKVTKRLVEGASVQKGAYVKIEMPRLDAFNLKLSERVGHGLQHSMPEPNKTFEIENLSNLNNIVKQMDY